MKAHPPIYWNPSELEEALAFPSILHEQPHAVEVIPQENHWSLFEALCRDSAATGNIIQDAWFAALAIESGCEWITVDRDYARFKGLRHSNSSTELYILKMAYSICIRLFAGKAKVQRRRAFCAVRRSE
jgi:hypothetical protein